MLKQILAGLESSYADIIFFCEHDVLYHPSHFDFFPVHKDVFYYNVNVYKWKYPEKFFVKVDDCKQTSGLCAYRELLLKHYRKRVSLVEKNGYTNKMGFEPGTQTRKERVDDYSATSWFSECPNIDVRHNKNLTHSRWSPEQFRNKKYSEGWTEVENVPCWGI